MYLTFKRSQYLILLLLSILVYSCNEESTEPKQVEPTAKIVIISDLHLYDNSLGITGSAFEDYLKGDRKMIAQSEELLKSVIATIIASDAKIVLVPGDLTKDGEKICHQKMATYLKQLEDAGKKVYVIPGNHDILNHQAYSYSGANKTKVDHITEAEFSTIYNEFGFKEAIYKDPNSLSYIVEPVAGLWIFCLDACQYDLNVEESIIGGAYSNETSTWIKTTLQEATTKNKIVLGMQHHGLIEHFTGQKTNPVSMNYVIEDWDNLSDDFAKNGMKAIFTGHFHANDIVKKIVDNNFIFDIETGSICSYPSPYRFVELTSDKKLKITSEKISSINYNLGGKTLDQYSYEFYMTYMTAYTINELMTVYGVSEADATTLAPVVAQTFSIHYAGDETMPAEINQLVQYLKASGDQIKMFFAYTLESVLTDLPPKDNNITIDLNNGNVTE